jgi:hypothetical protein
LRVEIGKRSIQLVAIPLIPACFQILLHTLPRKYQNLFPPAYFELRLGQLGPGISIRFQFGLLNLSFHSFAFPTSCHTPHSTAARGIHAALFFESFREMARIRFPYARSNNGPASAGAGDFMPGVTGVFSKETQRTAVLKFLRRARRNARQGVPRYPTEFLVRAGLAQSLSQALGGLLQLMLQSVNLLGDVLEFLLGENACLGNFMGGAVRLAHCRADSDCHPRKSALFGHFYFPFQRSWW